MLLTIPWFRPEPLRIPLPDNGVLDQLTIQPFGILVALAVVLGVQVALWRAKREGLHPRAVGELAGYQLIAAFVLGHVLDALFYHWDVVVERPMLLLELNNGLSSFGGFIGAAVGSVVWVRQRQASFLAFADPLAFSFPFGWFFGRVGCFTVHDHPGRVTDFVLGVEDYHAGLPPFQTRHDLGLYEVFWCAAAAGLFLYLGRRRRRRGFYLALLPLIYAPVRFGLDFLRATDVAMGDPRTLGLTPGHFGAVLLFAGGLAMVAWLRARPLLQIPEDARWPLSAPDDAERVSLKRARKLGVDRAPVRAPHLGGVRGPAGEAVARLPGRVVALDLSRWTPEEFAARVDELHEVLLTCAPIRQLVWIVPEPLLVGAAQGAPAALVTALAEALADHAAMTAVTVLAKDPVDVAEPARELYEALSSVGAAVGRLEIRVVEVGAETDDAAADAEEGDAQEGDAEPTRQPGPRGVLFAVDDGRPVFALEGKEVAAPAAAADGGSGDADDAGR